MIRKDVNDDVVDAIKNGAMHDQVRAVVHARANGPSRKVEADSAATHSSEHDDWSTPIPLCKVENPPAFPSGIFPSWLEKFVAEVSRALEVPPELSGMCALGVLATCFQKRFAVQVDSSYIEPLSLHLVTGSEPGSRKSPVFKLFFDPIHEFESRENARLQPIILERQRKRAMIEKSIASLQGKLANRKNQSHEADLDSQFKDLDALEIPVAPLLTMDDATPEAVGEFLAQQGGRMTIASAEGAFLDILRGRYSDMPAIEICLKGHAGDLLKIHRKDKSKPPIIVHSPALSLVFCIQPNVISTFGSVESLAGRGLLSRIVFILPKSTLGFRAYDQSPVNKEVQVEYCTRILTMIDLSENSDQAKGEIESEYVSCVQGVQTALKEFGRKIEPELQPGKTLRDKSGYLSGFAGKAPGLAVRVAGLLALANGSRVVNLVDFERGKRFVEFAIQHARIISGFVSEDPATADAKRVLGWIERKNERTIKRRDTCRDLNLTAAEAAAVLRLLEEHDYVRPVEPTPYAGSGQGRKSIRSIRTS